MLTSARVFVQAEKAGYWCWFAAVKPEHQRQGVFRAMLDAVTDKATTQKAVMGFLTSNSTNVRAAITVLFSQANSRAVTDRTCGAGGFHEQGAYESVCAVGRMGVLVLGERYTSGLSGTSVSDCMCTIFAI